MRNRTRIVVFIGAFAAHLALTLRSVGRAIDCGLPEDCLTALDHASDKVLAFPIFSTMEWLGPGGHSSGTMLTLLIPLNSLAFVVVLFFLSKSVGGAKKVFGTRPNLR